MCDGCLASAEPLSAEFFCTDCKTPFQNRYPLDPEGRCALCRLGARSFRAAYCFGAYEGVLLDLTRLFKYEGMKPLGTVLGDLLYRALPVDEAFDVVTPMPLHWRRRLERGFNQAEVLARHVARRRRLPLARAVRRVRDTGSQTGLTPAQRRRNVAGAFRVRRAEAVRGNRVLLIDDVMTTGATASACAAELKRAGAASVTVLALTRADRRIGSIPRGTS
ncbi:MAG: ComF family protein [Bryobacteraceae bacterium]